MLSVPPALSLDRVSLTFPDGTEALRDVSVAVPAGEMVAVVGPSGCGKSTLLRVAAGLERPTAGTVAADRGRLGYVFQDPTLLPWRTVRRNVELLAELRGVGRQQRQALAAAAIELVGLGGSEDRYPKTLSGGMRMRVSLARSLTLRPDVFLFDEPFAALDELTRERLNDELLRLFGAQGFAGLFVTHSVAEACFLAGRVVVMAAAPGRIVQEITVPFGYPRPPGLRFAPEFAALAGEASAALRGVSS